MQQNAVTSFWKWFKDYADAQSIVVLLIKVAGYKITIFSHNWSNSKYYRRHDIFAITNIISYRSSVTP